MPGFAKWPNIVFDKGQGVSQTTVSSNANFISSFVFADSALKPAITTLSPNTAEKKADGKKGDNYSLLKWVYFSHSRFGGYI